MREPASAAWTILHGYLLLFGERARVLSARLGFHSCAFRSTRRPWKRTPSASKRNRCSTAESPRNLISPPAPNTRCHGNPNPRRKIAATCLAAPGYPAARAIPPYVHTFPRGIARIARSICRRTTPGCSGSDLARRTAGLLVQVISRIRICAAHSGLDHFDPAPTQSVSRTLPTTQPSGTLPAPHIQRDALQTQSTVW
jgi:hypothetical protein